MNEIVISSHFSFSLTVKFLTFIFATIVIVISLTLSQDHIVVAQPQQFLEDLSFEAPDISMEKITITPQYVDDKLGAISKNKDLSQFIL